MDDNLIRYGMGRSYLPDWGYAEALREIFQNFTDFGHFDQWVEDVGSSEDMVHVKLVNEFSPEDHAFLKIGESGKRNDASTVGKHGEGLKMASMVLTREGRDVIIRYGSTALLGVFYTDPFLGECFGYLVSKGHPIDGFRIDFSCPKADFQRYTEKQLDPSIVLHSTYYGDLIDRPKGEVYVGGHFVSVVEGLDYAYNFKPECVELDRDRRVPRNFDVVYTASQILASWKSLQVKDIVAKDAEYLPRVPERIAKKFKPKMEGKRVVFRAGAVQAPPKVAEKLMEMPINQKRVAKLKFSLSRKQKPHSILKEFLDRYMRSLPPEGRADAQVLLTKAKDWKN